MQHQEGVVRTLCQLDGRLTSLSYAHGEMRSCTAHVANDKWDTALAIGPLHTLISQRKVIVQYVVLFHRTRV